MKNFLMPESRRSFLTKTAKSVTFLSISGITPLSSVAHSSCSTSSTTWLAGGTQCMQAPFPPVIDPFLSGLGNTCTLKEATIFGPCYFDVQETPLDISEGAQGVPMGVVLRIVDLNCQPIEGAKVEVWWANYQGNYSTNSSGAQNGVSYEQYQGDNGVDVPAYYPNFCEGEDNAEPESKRFRGTATSCHKGDVHFKGCFPGWYEGRSAHIHVRVTLATGESLTTQLGWSDDLAAEIYENHPDYTYTLQDTLNEDDMIFAEQNDFLFETVQQFDGSMLVFKALQVNKE